MILLCDHKEKITEEMCDPKVRTMQSTNRHFTKNKTKSNIFTTKINPNDPTLTLTQEKQKGQNPPRLYFFRANSSSTEKKMN